MTKYLKTSDTLEGNAYQKAKLIYDKFNISCFADDTGLEVDALDGRPGVYSARYAGENCNFDDNIDNYWGVAACEKQENCFYYCLYVLIIDNQVHYFQGKSGRRNTIRKTRLSGFGYDPVFKTIRF